MNRTPEETLAIAIANYRNARTILEDQLATALDQRNKAIVNALNAGLRQTDIAKTVGVTREQIRKIAISYRENAS